MADGRPRRGILVYNPTAGGAARRIDVSGVVRRAAARGLVLDAIPTERPRHATELGGAIERLRKPDLGVLSSFTSVELFEPVKLEATGALLHAKLHVSRAQVRYVMASVDRALQDLSKPSTQTRRPP